MELESNALLSLAAWGWFALLAIAGYLRPRIAPAPDALDPARVLTNVALGVCDLATSLAVPVISVAAAAWGNWRDFGLLHWIGLGGPGAFAVSLVLADFANWALHWLAHRWPLLWRLHRVHHSDTSLDVLTAYRHHPFETLAVGALQAALVALLGLDPAGVAAYALVVAFAAPLLHANVAWPVPALLIQATRALFMTPARHSLHHSALRQETDSNYGQFLSIWDRLAGTLLGETEARLDKLELGLGPAYRAGASRLPVQLALPFAPIELAAASDALGRNRSDA